MDKRRARRKRKTKEKQQQHNNENMEQVLSLQKGEASSSLWRCGLVCFASGAVMQAVLMGTMCADFEHDESTLATLGKAVIVGEIIGAMAWSAVADFVGRKEAICLACVLAAAACASMA